MATRHFFIGTDISKATLDVTILKDGLFVAHEKIDNTKEAIRQWFLIIAKTNGIKKSNSIFCTEAMGTYGRILLNFFHSKKLSAWVESPLRIKRSLGLQRGKNDKIDSLRIAEYCYRHQQDFKQWEGPRKELEELRMLNSMRSRIISCHKQLTLSINENYHYLAKKHAKTIQAYCEKSVAALKEDLKNVDHAIADLIKSDEHLCRLFKIITSVYAVGKCMAVELLIATNEFKNFDSPKKLACYCGVAPFEHTSGTSIKGKQRVSSIANRKIKTALHMCAVSAIRHSGDLRDYYLRKIAEGKHKMSVLNSIRNKIIHRIFACVKENRMYKR